MQTEADMRRLHAQLFVMLLLAKPVAAQTREAIVVRPGDSALRGSHITSRVTNVRYRGRGASGDTTEREQYRQRMEEHPVRVAGARGVLIVKVATGFRSGRRRP